MSALISRSNWNVVPEVSMQDWTGYTQMRCNIFTCYYVAVSKYITSNFSCKMHEQRLQNTCTQTEWASHETILLKEAHKPSSTCCNCHKAASHWRQPRKSCVKDTCQQKQCTMQRVLFPRAMSLGLGICAPEETLTWGCLGLVSAQTNDKILEFS